MLDDLQKRTAQAIVNIFETGSVLGDYASVTLLPNDPGHLTYGRSQTTLASGNLHLLIKAYCLAEGAALGEALSGFLERLRRIDLTLDHDLTFRTLLRRAGSDPVMHTVQDAFFDRVYWAPAVQSATALGLDTALGTAVVYDSTVHGSWARMRERTIRDRGTVQDLGERDWVRAYVEVRRDWLATHSNRLLRKTVYRMDAFLPLMDAGRWTMPLPLTVRGRQIDEDTLGFSGPVRASAEDPSMRILLLQTPLLVGDDIAEIQRALAAAGIPVDTDGIYGALTEAAVRRFQQMRGFTADGIVGPVTRAALLR